MGLGMGHAPAAHILHGVRSEDFLTLKLEAVEVERRFQVTEIVLLCLILAPAWDQPQQQQSRRKSQQVSLDIRLGKSTNKLLQAGLPSEIVICS